jgi:hypothetical protein
VYLILKIIYIYIGNFLPIVIGDKIRSDCKEDKRA